MDFKKAHAIFKRDFGAYFNSPIAYIVIIAFLVITGWLFFGGFFGAGGQEASMRSFFGMAPLFFAIFCPAITMRLLAEERRSGTIQLLATMPVRDIEVVVGKYMAAMGLIVVCLLLTVPWALSVEYVADPDWGPILGGYLGLLLMCSGYIAVGVMASALSTNQISAFVIAFLVCLAFYLMGKVLPMLPDSLVGIVEMLSFDHHFQNIARGVVDSRAIIYYLSVTTFGLAAADQALEARKWATA